jgi:iron complex transport system substrate-binding protein
MRAAARAGTLLALLAAAAAGAARAGEPAPARRIVSLNPSLTAILLAVGARGALVGVDDWSARQQAEVAGLPTVGGLFNPSLEAVVALAPDLVVLVPSAEQRDFRARLDEVGIARLELDPVSFEDVLDTIVTLGRRVGREAVAQERVAAIRATRRAVEERVRGRPPLRGVLVLQRDPLFVAGRGSFVDDMLRAVGVENLGAEFAEPWPRVSREWLIAAAPALLLDSSREGDDAPAYWARWPSLPAVRSGRVVRVPEGLTTLPGPALDRALLVLAGAAHGPALVRGLDGPAR